MLLSDGRRDEALAPAEQAVQAHSDSTAAFFTLGRVQAARNQTDAAIAAYKEALRLNPRATGAQVALARLHLASGKPAESVGFAQDAVKADPRNPDARLALVRGLIARGDLQRADPGAGPPLCRSIRTWPRACAEGHPPRPSTRPRRRAQGVRCGPQARSKLDRSARRAGRPGSGSEAASRRARAGDRTSSSRRCLHRRF